MKPKGFIHTLVLVCMTGALILPVPGCGDDKGISRSDDAVVALTFGGFWGVGLLVGAFIQYARFFGVYNDATVRLADRALELDAEPESSAIAYVAERDLTVVLLTDAVNDVTVELAVPGAQAGRFTLPAGELESPWVAIEIDGVRYTTSSDAQVVVDIKSYPDVEGQLVGTFEGRLEAGDGTLHDVHGTFDGTRVQ